jgi:protoporphyrin/coproporphyrin ferrochelatase
MPSPATLGIVLCNIGGPASAEIAVVRRFLRNFFRDPDILPVHPLLRWLLARRIAGKRGPESARMYAAIGGKSPVLEWTDRQARGLEERLNARGDGRRYVVAVAMRYSLPFTEDAVVKLEAAGCREVIALPLYPQECRATSGSSLAELDRVLAGRRSGIRKTGEVRDFAEHPGYLAALAGRIEEGLATFPDRGRVRVLFSAHGLPKRLVDAGDPYPRRIDATIDALRGHLEGPISWSLAYQSKVGKEAWLAPDTPSKIEELALRGVQEVLVVPISFVSDHLETLYEVEILFRDLAKRKGIARFECTRGLNDSPRFLEALEDLVVRAAAPSRAEAPAPA